MGDTRRMTADRFYGGIDGRLENLRAMLVYIAETNPSKEALLEWIVSNTEATSTNAIEHHLSFLTALDLIERDGGTYQLGEYGEQYHQTPDTAVLYAALTDGVKGFRTLLRALDDEPLTDEEIMDLLVSTYEECEMTTPGVAARHREWLQVIGYVSRDGDVTRITEAGRAALADSNITPDHIGQSELEFVDDEVTTETAPYYWVSHNWEEINEGYLQAPRTNFPNYDLQKLEIGDIVFNYVDGAVVGYSEVTTPAYVVKNEGEEHRRVDVKVTEFTEPLLFADIFSYLWREDVRLENYYPVNKAGMNQQYLFNLSEEAGEYLLEQGHAEGTNAARLEDRLALDDVAVDLPEELFFYGGEATRLQQQINAALNAGKHIIFTGPPGTGKTKIAKSVADQVATDDAVDDYTFTTATAEWSSFDTVGGYVPSQSDQELEFDPRLVLQCFRDDTDTIRNEWLVIDELNRANIDKALGPLFSVLSEDSVELPYEREGRIRLDWVDSESDLAAIATDPDRFPVTSAWRVLGTMNTFDKTSLYDLSFAFMRRFSFIHVGIPSLTNGGDTVSRELLDPDAGPNYATVWQRADPNLQETIGEWHEELAVIWAIVNDYRSIGPAIILDMLRQLDAFEGGDRTAALTSTLINYVFPQLEGLRQSKQEALLDDLVDGKPIGTDDDTTQPELRIDHPYLRQKANDMFDLELTLDPDTSSE